MTQLITLRLAIAISAVVAGCGRQDPGTSVDVALAYDDALELDTAEITLVAGTESGPIAHRMLLLVTDDLVGMDVAMTVWGRAAGRRAAYGTGTAVPVLGETVSAMVTLTACAPSCQGDVLTTCTGPTACALGCSEDGDPHCVAPTPSNGVDPGAADPLFGTTTIATDTTFDVDTGAITGGLSRAAGTGVASGIGYVQAPAMAAGGAPLGIFVFHSATVEAAATVRFTGTRAAVWLVGDEATIAGTLDVAAGHDARSAPGPAGGAGGTLGTLAQGCGPGGFGSQGTIGPLEDSGGGGGGAGTGGGAGGNAVTAAPPSRTPGGVGGKACLPDGLEPLQGGSGGGSGGPGMTARPSSGGGGGGALQITALGRLTITGTINAGGAGGEPGASAAVNAGAGAGGGGGGAILLESPAVTIAATAILAANGGVGGGGGSPIDGMPGSNGGALAARAAGGSSGSPNGSTGGAGGAGELLPDPGDDGTANAAGGGGAVGAIVIRARALMNSGLSSPPAHQLDVR